MTNVLASRGFFLRRQRDSLSQSSWSILNLLKVTAEHFHAIRWNKERKILGGWTIKGIKVACHLAQSRLKAIKMQFTELLRSSIEITGIDDLVHCEIFEETVNFIRATKLTKKYRLRWILSGKMAQRGNLKLYLYV